LGRGNSEKKDGERTLGGLDIDLEDQKVQRIPADESTPKKLTLQLDLEKPSLGDEKSPSQRRQPHQHPQQLQQLKPSKAEIKHEKSGQCFDVLFPFVPWFCLLGNMFVSIFLIWIFLCCSYACCYTTYTYTRWRLAWEFPTVWVSSFSCWIRSVHLFCSVGWFLKVLFCVLAVTLVQSQAYQELVFIIPWT
jgi:hypothetical protein